MTNNLARPVVRSNGTTGPQGFQGVGNYSTLKSYKKITVPKCFCGTCGLLNEEQIKAIYKSSFMIEDQNPLVFTLFGKDLTK